MDEKMQRLLAENALIDAEQAAENIGRNFVDADIAQYNEAGVNLSLGAEEFVRQYQGSNSFINPTLKGRLRQYGKLTSGQARAALNIMRQEMGHVPTASLIKCFTCDDEFPTWDALLLHKRQMHGSRQGAPEVFAETGEAKAVISNTEATAGLDLSNLPDGRYAAPDASGKNDYIFMMVKRVHKTHKRDRRYVYGKVVTGNEVVVAGTIEVKLWSSDSKELVGEQKPNDVYRGDLEDSLELIMLAPEKFAILFGRLCGHCCICGKTLTDEISRNIGMGIECEKKQEYFKKRPYSYVKDDRPDKENVNPEDELYLQGKLRTFREPPKVVPQMASQR